MLVGYFLEKCLAGSKQFVLIGLERRILRRIDRHGPQPCRYHVKLAALLFFEFDGLVQQLVVQASLYFHRAVQIAFHGFHGKGLVQVDDHLESRLVGKHDEEQARRIGFVALEQHLSRSVDHSGVEPVALVGVGGNEVGDPGFHALDLDADLWIFRWAPVCNGFRPGGGRAFRSAGTACKQKDHDDEKT